MLNIIGKQWLTSMTRELRTVIDINNELNFKRYVIQKPDNSIYLLDDKDLFDCLKRKGL